MSTPENSSLSRRSVLRTSAIGAAWVAPALVVVSASSANADVPSPGRGEEKPVAGPRSSTSGSGGVRSGAEQLPRTGATTATAATAGAGLVAGGAAMVFAARRGSAEPVADAD